MQVQIIVKADQSRMIYDFLCTEIKMVLVQENVGEKSLNKIGLGSFDSFIALSLSLDMVKPYNSIL